MTDRAKFYRHRVIHKLDTGWPSSYDDNIIICIPRGAWRIARDLLYGYGLRRNTYAVEYDESGYVIPDDALFDIIDNQVGSALEVCEMDCNAIVEALNRIALSSERSADCCQSGSGSAGAGGVDVPDNPFVDDGSNWPTGGDGFTNRSDYLTNKCQRANTYISGIIRDVTWFQAIDITGMTVTAMVASLLTPIPGDEVVLLIGAGIALLGQGLLAGFLTEFKDWLTTNSDELICILYDAADVGEAKSNLSSRASSDLSAGAKLLFDGFVTNSALNSLFGISAILDNLPNDTQYDCAGCAPLATYTWTFQDDYAEWQGDKEQVTTQGNGDTYSLHQWANGLQTTYDAYVGQATIEGRMGGSVPISGAVISIDIYSGSFVNKVQSVRFVGTDGYDETYVASGLTTGTWNHREWVLPSVTGTLTQIHILTEWTVAGTPQHGTLWDNVMIEQ